MSTTPTFAAALQELESINQWFQNEDINLEDALTKLKRGKTLIELCQTRLKKVENEFVQIKADFAQISKQPAPKATAEATETNDDDLPF